MRDDRNYEIGQKKCFRCKTTEEELNKHDDTLEYYNGEYCCQCCYDDLGYPKI